MKKNLLKAVLAIVSASIMLSLAGCAGGNSKKQVNSVMDLNNTSYPLQTDVTLRVWMPNASPVKEYGDRTKFPVWEEYQKRTGVKLKFEMPIIGSEAQQFSILVASGDMPDIVEYSLMNYPGGPQKAIDDDVAAPLNDLVDKCAPAFKKYLDNNPQIAKMIKTPNGNLYAFPNLPGDGQYTGINLSTGGYMIRKDWLDDLGLEVPTTIDEWTKVATAFKEKKGANSPIALKLKDGDQSHLYGAFGINDNFYQEDGIVKWGKYDAKLKNTLTVLNQWYEKGLLDKNAASMDQKTVNAKMINGSSGIMFGYLGGQMGGILLATKQSNPTFNLVGIPSPTLLKGEKPKFSVQNDAINVNYGGTFISNSCKNKEIAAKMLDYTFTKEGWIYRNYGVEGLTYNMVNGVPTYNDFVTKNPNGLTVPQALSLYTAPLNQGPADQKGNADMFYPMQQQKDALKIYNETDGKKYVIPPLYPTTEQSNEVAKLTTDLKTYSDEMILKFIIGEESLDKFDNYMSEMKKKGAEALISLKQKMYDETIKK